MSRKARSVTQSLALATAAFLSMAPATQAQETSPCGALRSGRVPKRVRIENLGPWSLRIDSDGQVQSGHVITNVWNSTPNAPNVRVGAEVVDVRIGVRVDCVQTNLAGGEGTALRIDIDGKSFNSKFGPPMAGVRVIVVHDPSTGVKRNTALPFVSGNVESNVLYNNENITAWQAR